MIGCLFEQSGTFKNTFRKYGYDAEDIDIQNTFNETDIQCDLFYMIESRSIVDLLKKYDFCMCFFPCTWFSDFNNMIIAGTQYQMQTMDEQKKQKIITDRLKAQSAAERYLKILVNAAELSKTPMIIENPLSVKIQEIMNGYDYAVHKRSTYGDFYDKRTIYYFVGDISITPFMETMRNEEYYKIVHQHKGLSRSLISEMYVDNLIRNIYKPSEFRYMIEC